MQQIKFALKWPESVYFDIFGLWNKNTPTWISSDITEEVLRVCIVTHLHEALPLRLIPLVLQADCSQECLREFTLLFFFPTQFYFMKMGFPNLEK